MDVPERFISLQHSKSILILTDLRVQWRPVSQVVGFQDPDSLQALGRKHMAGMMQAVNG